MNRLAPAIFLGAFLVFLVQPLIARFILPWFGGSSGVWATCLLFFQVFLLIGYSYAHFSVRFLKPRAQATLHMALLLVALVFLPVVPGSKWEPDANAAPVGRILLLLTTCLGFPYLVLSATAPLLQAWHALLWPGSPYRLYSVSNSGSLIAVISFPFVFEPYFTRRELANLWAVGFVGFVLLCLACAWKLWQTNPPAPPVPQAGKEFRRGPDAECGRGAQALWFGLALCGAVLLLAITNKLCQDVAVVPFLWVLPLSLYLATFILCFEQPISYRRNYYLPALVAVICLVCYFIAKQTTVALAFQLATYCAMLFVGCMACHGELYRLKPDPRHLTHFYLMIAAGGAAGGVLVAIVAPAVFRSYAELPWGMVLLALLLTVIHARERQRWKLGRTRLAAWPVLAIATLALVIVLQVQASKNARDELFASRNFYGVLRVSDLGKDTEHRARRLMHGHINHGLQFLAPTLSRLPTSYYNEPSGVGLAIQNLPAQTNRSFGVVGLGAGTLATYTRPGDRMRFYEINPEVQRLAETQFTFLRQATGRIEVVLGDARLSLEHEPPQQFDLLVLDAFSGDAVPVHLLTREAFAVYLRHLKPAGVIAVHTSNRHLDLAPVLRGVAAQFQLGTAEMAWLTTVGHWWYSSSTWVLLSRNRDFLNTPQIMDAATAIPPNPPSLLWTDDYASMFRIVNW